MPNLPNTNRAISDPKITDILVVPEQLRHGLNIFVGIDQDEKNHKKFSTF